MQKRAPLVVAICLLILPIVYVGSYLALVTPHGVLERNSEGVEHRYPFRNYRVGYDMEDTAERFYWPLEQIDRKVRPASWDHGW